jgi:hypothetical protein
MNEKFVEVLNLAADGREEYAKNCDHMEWKEFMLGQAAAYRSAARLLESGDWMHLITAQCPSWRWPKEVDDAVMGRTRRKMMGEDGLPHP